jgi:flagellar basal-body rod protein FlgC
MGMSVMQIAGRAMSAQLTRLDAVAGNLANAGTVAGSAAEAYRARRPVFETVLTEAGGATVDVRDTVSAGPSPTRRHDPGHPLADPQGDVWAAGVDPVQELVEMLEASRQYQNNVEVMATAKTLVLDTLRLGQ